MTATEDIDFTVRRVGDSRGAFEGKRDRARDTLASAAAEVELHVREYRQVGP